MKKTLVGTILLMAGLLALPPVGVAGTITFNDLTDFNSITSQNTFGGAGDIITCDSATPLHEPVFCIMILHSPMTTPQPTMTFTPSIPLGSSTGIDILEPGTGAVSDQFTFTAGATGLALTIDFMSDTETGLSRRAGFPTLTEDGTVQTVLTVTYSVEGIPIGSDTIRFQSDVERSVPEPSSLLLLGLGVLGVGWSRRLTGRR